MSIYRRVLNYYRPYLPHTILGLLLSLGGIALNLLKPWPFKVIVDQIIPSFRTNTDVYVIPDFSIRMLGIDLPHFSTAGLVALLCLSLVLIQLFWAFFNWGSTYIFVKVGLQALLKLRTDLY